MGEMEKLEKYLGGVKEMKKLPGAMFVVDPRKEHNRRSQRLASCTSPSSQSSIPTATPMRSITLSPATTTLSAPSRLIAATMADAVSEGRQGARAEVEAEPAEAEAEQLKKKIIREYIRHFLK